MPPSVLQSYLVTGRGERLKAPHPQKESFYCVNVSDADQMNGVMWLYM
jgi:hypothetical protein